jgi:hypothetical protein
MIQCYNSVYTKLLTFSAVPGINSNIFHWLGNDAFLFLWYSPDLSPFYSFLAPQGTTFTTYRINIDGTGMEEVPTLRPYMSLLESVSGFGVNRIIDTDPAPTPAADR